VNDSTDLVQGWEVPTLTPLGDLEAITSAGAAGSEDGGGFTSF
jgi:hypothetical protein